MLNACNILRELRESFDSQFELGYQIVASAYQSLANGPAPWNHPQEDSIFMGETK